MSIEISPKSFFEQPSVADMRLISCPGAEELTGLIDLVESVLETPVQQVRFEQAKLRKLSRQKVSKK